MAKVWGLTPSQPASQPASKPAAGDREQLQLYLFAPFSHIISMYHALDRLLPVEKCTNFTISHAKQLSHLWPGSVWVRRRRSVVFAELAVTGKVSSSGRGGEQ